MRIINLNSTYQSYIVYIEEYIKHTELILII